MYEPILSSGDKPLAPRELNIDCRVLFVGWSSPPYNGMSTATEIVRSAISTELDVVFVDLVDKRDLSNVGKFELRNVLLAMKNGLTFLHLLLKKKPEIVYVPIAQQWLPFLRDCLFLIPARIAKRKVIIHLHGSHFGEFWAGSGRAMRFVIRFALSRAARVIVLGECLRHLFDGVVSSNRVVVIPNGIPDYGNERTCERSNGQTLLYLGALMKSKGVLDLLSAMPFVRKEIPRVRLLLTGEWLSEEDRIAAMAIVARNGLKDCVEFTGSKGKPEKYNLYRSADIFVMPTFYPNEGHPYSILEAMCAGLPIVTTDVACIPETVIDGETGYIVPRNDVTALAGRLAGLLQDDNLRNQMGVAARRRFEHFYTDHRFNEQIRAVFREVAQS